MDNDIDRSDTGCIVVCILVLLIMTACSTCGRLVDIERKLDTLIERKGEGGDVSR